MPTLAPTSAVRGSEEPSGSRGEDTRIYEFAILYPAGLTQKDEAELIKEIEGLFEEAQGKQVARDAWGKRGIAYSIKGQTEGNFVIYYYELDPSKVKEIDSALKIMRNVLRHLVVKPPKGYVIQQYSELYEQWLKERETVDQKRTREREEQVQERVAKKAKAQAQRSTERKKDAAPKQAIEEEVLTEKIDQLISDEDLSL